MWLFNVNKIKNSILKKKIEFPGGSVGEKDPALSLLQLRSLL